MHATRARLAVVPLLAVLVLVPAAGVQDTAAAVDQSKGYPGFCKTDVGVTVVVDFRQLGGTTLVRCNPSRTRGTGLDALKDAGFQIAGVQRWGEAFICRIENRPSAVEKLAVQGSPGYREQCVDTPPATAYWAYWHAGNNCSWHYSQWGVKNRDFVQGGFEGWSFSLNASTASNPVPRIAPVRPGTAGGTCAEPDEAAPTTNDPNEAQSGTTADKGYVPDPGAGATPTSGSAGDPNLPPPRPRNPQTAQAGSDPADNVTFSGGETAPDVNDVIKKQAHASDLAPWVAGGVVVLLGLLSWVTARRRRRVRLDA